MSELSKAIIAAANMEYSNFKDVISQEVEAKLKTAVADKIKEKELKVFNPDYEMDSVEQDDVDPVSDPESDEIEN